MTQTLYQELVAAGCAVESHYSDLRVKVCPVSRPIIERHCWIAKAHKCELFTSPIDGALWWDVPFAYDPFWQQNLKASP